MDRMNEIARVVCNSGDEKLIQDFLRSILTPAEVKDISLRWELVKMLDQGISQREISRRLGISLCKITRGSRELRKNHSAFKRCLEVFRQVRRSGSR